MKPRAKKTEPNTFNIQNSNAADWIDKQGVMERFFVSDSAIQKWRANNTVPHGYLGGKIFYHLPGIIKLLEDSANSQHGRR